MSNGAGCQKTVLSIPQRVYYKIDVPIYKGGGMLDTLLLRDVKK